MKRLSLLTFILLITGDIPGGQSYREKPEPTDELVVHRLKGLRQIDLTIEADIFSQKKVSKKPNPRQYYFRVSGEETFEKVSFTGTNLGDYLYGVPEAHGIMKSYGTLKVSSVGSFYGGLGVFALGLALTLFGEGSVNPILLVGAAVVSVSWLPKWASHNKVSEAVAVYNEKIGEYEAEKKESTRPVLKK